MKGFLSINGSLQIRILKNSNDTHTSSLEDLSSRWPLGVEACFDNNNNNKKEKGRIKKQVYYLEINDVILERANPAKRYRNEIQACPCGAVPKTTTDPFDGHQSDARLDSTTHAQNPFILKRRNYFFRQQQKKELKTSKFLPQKWRRRLVIISPKEKTGEREAPTCVGGAIPCKQEIKTNRNDKLRYTNRCWFFFIQKNANQKPSSHYPPIINIIKNKQTNKPLKSRHVRQRIFLSLPIISNENKEKVSRKKNVKQTKTCRASAEKSSSLSVIQFS